MGFLLPIKQVFALAFSVLSNAAIWVVEGRFLLFPEQVCNVVHLVFVRYPIHTLIGAAAVQSAQMANVRTHFDVVEVGQLNIGRQRGAPCVPANLQFGVVFPQIGSQAVDGFGFGIAAHKADTRNALAVFSQHLFYCLGCKRVANIFPKKGAVAARAAARAVGKVDSQRNLVGKLLENDVGVYEFKHRKKL